MFPDVVRRTTYEDAYDNGDYEVGAKVVADDDDTDDVVIYNITDHLYEGMHTGDAPYSCFQTKAFRITKQGQLMLLRSLQGCTTYDTTTNIALNYTVEITATDSTGLTDTVVATVTVVDGNSKPTIDDVSVSVSDESYN